MSKNGAIVLSYYDSLIYESDVELLSGPYWLNDTIIGFYLEYLEREVYDDLDFCFIRPEIAQCLKFSSVAELSVFLDPLKFKEKSFAFIPFNDCERPDAAGGSHWSLIVYSKPERTFFYVDSSLGSSTYSAKILSSKLSDFLHMSNQTDFKIIQSIQQSNSYDCGVFVLCNIDNVIKQVIRFNKVNGVDLLKFSEVSRKRREVKVLIESLVSR